MPGLPPNNQRAPTAVLIGQPATCRRLERQLDLLEQQRPISIGWIVCPEGQSRLDSTSEGPILGTIDQLEHVLLPRRPGLALVSLPAAMKELIQSIRTRLRKLGVPDRFLPTLEDQIAGVGPRTQIDIDPAELLNRPAKSIDEPSISGVISGRRVLITGAGGTIGGELARIVARFAPQQLILVDRSENSLFEIDRQIARNHPEMSRRALLHDVVNERETLRQFREIQPQIIFHAAAHKHVPMMEDHPAAAVDNNLFGTKSVADAADAVGAERFVMISTDKAVNPCSIMGATKRLAELYVQWINQRSGTAFSMVRFGNVLGSSGSVLEIWAKQIADGGPMTVTDPRMTRYFMTIPEAAALVIQSAALVDVSAASGEVFLLDMGQPIRIVELARRFATLHGLDAILPEHAQSEGNLAGTVRIVYSGPRPGEKLHEELAFEGESLVPTRHPDIKIWTLPLPADDLVQGMVRQLSPRFRQRESPALAAQIRSFVQETAGMAATPHVVSAA